MTADGGIGRKEEIPSRRDGRGCDSSPWGMPMTGGRKGQGEREAYERETTIAVRVTRDAIRMHMANIPAT